MLTAAIEVNGTIQNFDATFSEFGVTIPPGRLGVFFWVLSFVVLLGRLA